MRLETTLAITPNPLIYKGEKIVLAGNTWMWYNVVMESSYTFSLITTETRMKDPINDPLTHSGKMMLSGMTAKPASVTEAEVQAFLDSGGEIKQIKSRKTRKHTTRTKSHMMGGLGSRYLSGGTRNQAGRSRKAS